MALPITSILLTAFFSFLINFTYGQVNETVIQTYENRDMGIRFSYPTEWGEVIEKTGQGCHNQPDCVITFGGTAPTATYGLGFTLGKLSKESCNCASLKDFVKLTYQILAKEKGFSFINDSQTTIGKNHSAWQYQFSILDNGKSRMGRSVQVGNNDNYYAILTSYPNESRAILLPKINKFIESMEFLPIPVAKKPSFMDANETQQLTSNTLLETESNGLETLSHNSFTDSVGYMHVVGEVQNNSPTIAQFVQVTGTFYDNNNQVVGTQFTYTNPSDIGAGEKAPFDLTLLSASIPISEIDHYNLEVSSQNQVGDSTHQSSGEVNRPVTSKSTQPPSQQYTPTMGRDDPDCGKVIHGIFNLTNNIVCDTMDGLIVGGDNTTVNFNGFSITGGGPDSQKVGISIPHADNVFIQGNGTISNFQAGILISGSENAEIKRISFEGNKIGLFLTGSIGTSAQDNNFDSNSIGIASHSSVGTQLGKNVMTENELAGITFVNSDKSQIETNSISGSKNGIYLDYESRKNIVENNVLKNDIDLNNDDGLPINVNGNELLKNNCLVSNPDGFCNSKTTDSGTGTIDQNSVYQNKNCSPISLVLCEGPSPCPNGYHRSPDGDCETARD